MQSPRSSDQEAITSSDLGMQSPKLGDLGDYLYTFPKDFSGDLLGDNAYHHGHFLGDCIPSGHFLGDCIPSWVVLQSLILDWMIDCIYTHGHL